MSHPPEAPWNRTPPACLPTAMKIRCCIGLSTGGGRAPERAGPEGEAANSAPPAPRPGHAARGWPVSPSDSQEKAGVAGRAGAYGAGSGQRGVRARASRSWQSRMAAGRRGDQRWPDGGGNEPGRCRPTARCPRACARGFYVDRTAPRRSPTYKPPARAGGLRHEHHPGCNAEPRTPNGPVSPGLRPGLLWWVQCPRGCARAGLRLAEPSGTLTM
jgi:hypothetical protein